MEMQPVIAHRGESTFIGYSIVVCNEEGFRKCPEFWDEQYARRFAHLFQTMKPETPEEQAVLDNRIGQFALCRCMISVGQDGVFEYMICGEYCGGPVPEGMKLLTVPESDWAEFRSKGALPKSLQDLYEAAYGTWLKDHREYREFGINLERYTPGNPATPDYECGLIIPVKKAGEPAK
jgi:AraC family transcriptional regulator